MSALHQHCPHWAEGYACCDCGRSRPPPGKVTTGVVTGRCTECDTPIAKIDYGLIAERVMCACGGLVELRALGTKTAHSPDENPKNPGKSR